MKVLISNDDGVQSQGLRTLSDAIKKMGAQVTVVAPSGDRSAVGHSLTLHKPLRAIEVAPDTFAISGSPADCVHWATRFLLKDKPDLVISGINKGANLGYDLFYSGTVAAAREGALFGCRAIAMSLCTFPHSTTHQPHWNSAAHAATILVPKIMALEYPISSVVFNVNVPDCPLSEIKGIRISQQGHRLYSDDITEGTDPRGKKYYWIGGKYLGFKELEGSDCDHIQERFVSVVPSRIDTTHYELSKKITSWETTALD